MQTLRWRSWLAQAVATAMVLATADSVEAQPAADLESGFAAPPRAARPRVWWHWMNGNVTKEGITRDMEWMRRVGVGGFQTFDAALHTPQVVEERLVYMTPRWKEAFRHATETADALGLEMGIAGSPGWSESGGPWVTPAQAMKKLVWSETLVEGGRRFTGRPAQPPETTGPFQNVPYVAPPWITRAAHALRASPTFYADTAVVAYRIPSDAAAPLPAPRVTSSAASLDAARLGDGDYTSQVELPVGSAAQPAWLQIDFGEPQVLHALSVAMAPDNWARPLDRRPVPPLGTVEASDHGNDFRVVAMLPGFGVTKTTPPQHTIALPGVRARYLRVVFASPPANSDFRTASFPPSAAEAQVHRIAELVVHREPRIDRFEEKAAFGTLIDYYANPTPPAGDQAIPRGDVVELTSQIGPDGTLDWSPPPGRWMVLRLGYSLIGTENHPASPEATGLEVDKLSRRHVRAYLGDYLDQYRDATGGLMGERGLGNMITDSWEAGVANWTDDMRSEFGARAGYDITPFLPVLTGRVVESAEASERFLWDFRRVVGDLTVDNHYGEISRLLHGRGMRQYGESIERERRALGDGMAMKHLADVPMGAFWVRRAPNEAMPNYGIDLRESASVAHLYGQNLVAAESLTANAATNGWIDSPRTLKPVADHMLALGLNQFVLHTSVHQPLADAAPGLTLGVYGQHFNRNETWAEQAQAWISYLARSSYLLQQGRYVADIAYFYGEEAPLTALFKDDTPTPPEVPEGYSFDFVNAHALAERLSVRDGRLVTASGGDYALLYLGGSSRKMTLRTARKLRELARAGAVVVGARPEGSPSLADDDAELESVLDELWGTVPATRGVGRGRVFGCSTLAETLRALPIQPDLDYGNPDGETELMFVHRRRDDADIYFVTNRRARAAVIDLSLRVAGREAEIWRADTGQRSPASYRIESGRTAVPISLDPDGALFVVLRKPASVPVRVVPEPIVVLSTPVDKRWRLDFPAGRGAPSQVTVERLGSWADHEDPGVRYFSGTATYSRELDAPDDWFRDGSQIWLDLGDVREVAEVRVGGGPAQTLWKRPYRANITSALKPGRNRLEIQVTNLWPNRLIGDLQPGARKYTFTVRDVYRPDSPLLPSGLLGPVRVDVLRTEAAGRLEGGPSRARATPRAVHLPADLRQRRSRRGSVPGPPALGRHCPQDRNHRLLHDGVVHNAAGGGHAGPDRRGRPVSRVEAAARALRAGAGPTVLDQRGRRRDDCTITGAWVGVTSAVVEPRGW
jgi:hypothetical protein